MPRRNPSLFSAITNRETYGANFLRDLNMLRRLIERDGRYKKVWEKSSKSPISYEGNMFFDGYRTCYNLDGLPDEPRLVYQQRKPPSARKIESFLVFESPLDQTTFSLVKGTSCRNSSFSIALTKDNHLKVFDMKNGETLEVIHLSCGHNFKYLFWETDFQRILAKSTLSPQRAPHTSGMPRVPTTTHRDHVLYLAVLSVCPLQFLCTLPISKHIFGMDVCNASIRNGLLIVMHLRGKITFYSFDDLLKYNSIPLKLGDHLKHGNTLDLPEFDNFTSGVIGVSPIGLPVNVRLSEKPCVLFEAYSNNHDLSFGGFPWHYIRKINQIFQVKSLRDDRLAKNGHFESNALSIEADKAFFHADLSGRILHIEASVLRCFKLGLRIPNSEHYLSEQFVLDFSKLAETRSCVRTQSGRHVKQLYDSYRGNIECEVILDVDYDDELDILVVLFHDQAVNDGGIVGFYDNQTGHTLRTLKVDGITEEGEHSVVIDRNALVILSKNMTRFVCIVYALLPGI